MSDEDMRELTEWAKEHLAPTPEEILECLKKYECVPWLAAIGIHGPLRPSHHPMGG